MFVANIVFNFGKAIEILHPQVKPLDENQTWDRLFDWVSGHMTYVSPERPHVSPESIICNVQVTCLCFLNYVNRTNNEYCSSIAASC